MMWLYPIAAIAALSSPGYAVTSASASPDPYDFAREPGVFVSVDCSEGQGHVAIANTDMAGSSVEVTIDGARQPDLHVDSGGNIQQWYGLVVNRPHRMTIIFGFVPGGTPEEENRMLTASCLDDTASPTAPVVRPPAFNPISPARVWDSRFGPGPTGQVAAGETRKIKVAGVGGVPLTGVTAVVRNVTAVNPTAATYVTAWPTVRPSRWPRT